MVKAETKGKEEKRKEKEGIGHSFTFSQLCPYLECLFSESFLSVPCSSSLFMETKICPKCGAEMSGDRQLGSYTEITLKKGEQFIGDRVKAFYCIKCGYVELYREKKP